SWHRASTVDIARLLAPGPRPFGSLDSMNDRSSSSRALSGPGLADPDLASPAPGDAAAESSMERIGRFRWFICALLFFATTINYLDRMVLGILAPTLQIEVGWTEAQYG